jgi:hypothetical protein
MSWLVYAGPAVWSACTLVIVVVLWRAATRPADETDRRCAEIDMELSRREL